MEHSIVRQPLPKSVFGQINSLYKDRKEQMESYISQLLWWNSRLNLISRDVSRETIKFHVLHSLLLATLSEYKKHNIIIDAGTGGGLPGIPLAITTIKKKFILNDIVTKKTLAVKQIGRKLGLENITVDDHSIQDVAVNDPFLLISKHAFKINDLIDLTAHLPWEKIILCKGIAFEEELKGIKVPLNIKVYDLFEESQVSFYKDKAIIVIEK